MGGCIRACVCGVCVCVCVCVCAVGKKGVLLVHYYITVALTSIMDILYFIIHFRGHASLELLSAFED